MSARGPREERPFARVARRLGIALDYRDVYGESHRTSEETLAALFEAFGLPPDPLAAERELAAREGRAPFGLPAALVIGDGQRELSLRTPPGARRLRWIYRIETGGEVSGELDLSASGERAPVPLPAELPQGYHALSLEAGAAAAEVSLIVAPQSCYLPAGWGRSWGLLCQLYGLRSARNWGIGDFGDLEALARELGADRAAILGTNPLHALFAAEPRRISPYAPSHRSWLNPLYIDVTAVPGFAENGAANGLGDNPPLAAARRAARAAEFVDYPAVAALKEPVFEALYAAFRARELGDAGAARGPRGAAFRQFQKEGGKALEDFAQFEALCEHFGRTSGNFSWRLWPQPFRDPASPEVRDFASQHRDRIEFFQFLQWEADRQLGLAAAAGRRAGLSVGLYRDLAVGSDPDGAEVWADQALFATAAVGAPPDPLAPAGQDWGLPPWNPIVLQQRGFAPFVALLRANMRHAGTLRLDHVMALARLFWIPKSMPAKAGTYVSYPLEELLGILALESRRQRCAVIGEDLGTVPADMRSKLQERAVLSFRVLVFERDAEGRFLPPERYPALAAATADTHDLATVKGFWLARDIAWRRRLSLYPDAPSAQAEAAGRHRDRQLLLEALAGQGLLDPERFPEFLSASGEPSYSPELLDAILLYLARSPARLLLVGLEDLMGEEEQPNLPGTVDAHPNGRRRARLSLEGLFAKGEIARIARLIAEVRPAAESETNPQGSG